VNNKLNAADRAKKLWKGGIQRSGRRAIRVHQPCFLSNIRRRSVPVHRWRRQINQITTAVAAMRSSSYPDTNSIRRYALKAPVGTRHMATDPRVLGLAARAMVMCISRRRSFSAARDTG
jgi:hypothetical protein